MDKKIGKMTLQTPRIRNFTADDFIQAAEEMPPSTKSDREKILPWEEGHVRQDVVKLFNLRLNEPLYLKLKFLSEKKKDSIHKICSDILIPGIEKELKNILD